MLRQVYFSGIVTANSIWKFAATVARNKFIPVTTTSIFSAMALTSARSVAKRAFTAATMLRNRLDRPLSAEGESIGAKLPPMEEGPAIFPCVFEPPNPSAKPQDIFDLEHRFIRDTDPREILFFVDGACIRNSQGNPQGGCAFLYRPTAFTFGGFLTHAGMISFPLELRGPTGCTYKHTRNRSNLRAAVAVLQFRDWSVDCNSGWRSIVTVTDSEYIAEGATTRAKRWESVGWRTYNRKQKNHTDVKDHDLWQLLLVEIRKLHSKGVRVSFWRVPYEHGKTSEEVAQEAAEDDGLPDFAVIIPTGPDSIDTKPY
ncbi:hypothetical protein ONS95_005208 [Cadophora gregata]|uniref:uncharacterized protein n=1 Tax=Cadophora gregata TaxID=51156 RepID=UPI0026DD7BAB|nr:uncharacterized protein ONS95_005208 [Cadophora gregata]KAK0104947.1 hypothetical protein ONS95_005208 [Cadophora gregata]KAK0114972.1 hypothetical protein ONS96_013446 [Cadophora gregata f. sp. sojae]